MLMDVSGFDRSAPMQPSEDAALAFARPKIDLRRQWALFRRRLRVFAVTGVVVFGLVMLATYQMAPRYTASGEVMLDPRQLKVTNVEEVLSGLPSDANAIESEVDVLRSRNLAEKVAVALDLFRDPEFNRTLRHPSSLDQFFASLTRKHGSAADSAHQQVVDAVMSGLSVARSGSTYGIRISYTAGSPKRAADIANAFADQYLLEQLDAKFEATRRASDWLSGRLSGLKTQVEQADSAVARYKSAHGLMGLASNEGATIAQQEISTINTALAQAKAQQAESDANLSTAKSQLAKGSTGDDLGASLGSLVINQLRQQRAVISAQVADLQGRYGALHPEMLKAKRQLADIDTQIQAEIRRITSNLEAQAAIAKERSSSIEHSLASARSSLSDNGAASVQLNDLERNAASLSSLYQNFLDRFKQTQNQEGFAQSDARVISRAKPPFDPSYPNLPLSLILSTLSAAVAAFGAVSLAQALDSGIYTSEDVETFLRLPCLGSLPTVDAKIGGAGKAGERRVSPTQYVLEKPLSAYAEAFRNLRTSIIASRMGEPVGIVAMTSALPGEGKTTASICLGRVMAMGGVSTVIVDCDLRRRALNSLFNSGPSVGLLEVLSGAATLDAALIHDTPSGAVFLPLADARYTPRDVFSSPAMEQLLVKLRERFDMVILDTAPVLPVADTRVLAPKADVTVFLAQWRKTPRKAIETAIRHLEPLGAHIVGVTLTQVDLAEQSRSGYGDPNYYSSSYAGYYVS